MRRLLSITLCGSLLSCSSVVDDDVVSNLKTDERIVFFSTDASRTDDGKSWRVPIHAWVHEPQDTQVRKGVFAAVLKTTYGLEPNAENTANFDRRVQLFVVDNERDKRVVIRLAGTTFTLPPTGPNGQVIAELELDADLVSTNATDGQLRFTAVLPGRDTRVFAGVVQLVDRHGLSVISDIDDTVKVTEVKDRAAMFERTFFRDFEAAPGMGALYMDWARQGAAFHFVSSSPWHLYEPLDAFLTNEDFPPRSLSLKLVRVKDRSLLDLLRTGAETKPAQIEPLLERFPDRRFILVGDSGEQDPEVYGTIARQYPEQIQHIYIRNVDASVPDDERFRTAFSALEPERWTLFTEPAELR